MAGIEFAFMLPIFVLLLVGISDLAAASKLDRDLKRASASIAYLATRSPALDAATKTEIRTGLTAVLGDAQTAKYRIRIDGIANDNGTVETYWTWQPFGATRPPEADRNFDGTLLPGRGGVVVRVEQDFESFFGTGGFGEYTVGGSHAATSSVASRIILN